VQVDTFADLNISLRATTKRAASSTFRVMSLGAVFVCFILLVWTSNRLKPLAATEAERY